MCGWYVPLYIHFPSSSLIKFKKMQLRVSKRCRKAGGLAVQDRGLVWRQQVGSGAAAITCLALAAPGSPPGSTRATLRQLCPPLSTCCSSQLRENDTWEKNMCI